MVMPRAVLIGEGNDDASLLNIVTWMLSICTREQIQCEWVDVSKIGKGRPTTLNDRVNRLKAATPPDLLFVHRDADKDGWEPRIAEIQDAVGALPCVPVVPVRATEAWFLLFEPELRRAAGRASSRAPLNLPALRQIEGLGNPKMRFAEALRDAAGVTRLPNDHARSAALHRMSELIQDWSPLRQLPAVQRLEAHTRTALTQLGLPLLS